MASHALAQNLFADTDAGMGTDGTAAPLDGAKLIDGWLKVIDGHTGTETVKGRLEELRGQLRLANPDPFQVQDLLMDIADHTSQMSQGRNISGDLAGQLENLATSLRLFAMNMQPDAQQQQ